MDLHRKDLQDALAKSSKLLQDIVSMDTESSNLKALSFDTNTTGQRIEEFNDPFKIITGSVIEIISILSRLSVQASCIQKSIQIKDQNSLKCMKDLRDLAKRQQEEIGKLSYKAPIEYKEMSSSTDDLERGEREQKKNIEDRVHEFSKRLDKSKSIISKYEAENKKLRQVISKANLLLRTQQALLEEREYEDYHPERSSLREMRNPFDSYERYAKVKQRVPQYPNALENEEEKNISDINLRGDLEFAANRDLDVKDAMESLADCSGALELTDATAEIMLKSDLMKEDIRRPYRYETDPGPEVDDSVYEECEISREDQSLFSMRPDAEPTLLSINSVEAPTEQNKSKTGSDSSQIEASLLKDILVIEDVSRFSNDSQIYVEAERNDTSAVEDAANTSLLTSEDSFALIQGYYDYHNQIESDK